MVHALLERGVRARRGPAGDARSSREYGDWPLSRGAAGRSAGTSRPRIVLRERDGRLALSPRGWQLMVAPPPLEDVRLRLRRAPE